MLNQQTCFVIGAGASFDFGFPLGDQLRGRIINLLAPEDANHSINFQDGTVSELLRGRCTREVGVNRWTDRIEDYRRAATIIRNGLPFARSIDSFLDGLRNEPEVTFLGKLAIAIAILRAESAAPMVDRHDRVANAEELRAKRVEKMSSSWHADLCQIVYEGHTRETVDQVFQNVSFVIFNYDRCIEEFLTLSLMRRFAIERPKAIDALSRCRIIHPYGQVGGFFDTDEDYVPFGGGEVPRLEGVAAGIRTFTEAMEEDIAGRVKDAVADAETLVFMGFGWLPQNMQLLTATDRATNADRVFATTMDMAAGEIEVVADQIDQMLRRKRHSPPYASPWHEPPQFINELGSCKALMRNCWLRLTRT